MNSLVFLPCGNNIKAVKRVVKQVLENYERKVLSAIPLIDLSKVFDCTVYQTICLWVKEYLAVILLIKDFNFPVGVLNVLLKIL